jgi:tetratricopeptide (TPR) repeat protein
MRPEGAVLLVSIVAVLAATRLGRRSLRFVALPVAAWVAFLVFWFQAQQHSNTEFGGDFVALLTYWPRHPFEGLAMVAKIPQIFVFATWERMRLISFSAATRVSYMIILIGVAGFGMGLYSVWKTRALDRIEAAGVAMFCLLYFAAHVFWHVAASRYFIPIFPFVLIFSVLGISRGLEGVKKRKVYFVGLAVILLGSYAYENGRGIYQEMSAQHPTYAPPWRSLEWLKKNTDRFAKVGGNIAPNIALYTGRVAVGGQAVARNADMFLYVLLSMDLDYIVSSSRGSLTPGVGQTKDPNIMWARYRRWCRLYPGRFKAVFYDPVEKIRIYRINPDPEYLNAFEKFMTAVKYVDERRYAESFQMVNECLALEPDLGCAMDLKGVLYLFRNDISNAEAAFRRAAELLPDSSKPMLNLAALYHERGQDERTSECIQRALEIGKLNANPENALQVRGLKRLWAHNRNRVFIDSPDPDFFNETERAKPALES